MTDVERYQSADPYPGERLALVDLLDRVLAGGVVITGEITLSVADVDLVVISLRALLTSVSTLAEQAMPAERQWGTSNEHRGEQWGDEQ